MIRKLIPWVMAATVAASAVTLSVARPAGAQVASFPLFFDGEADGTDLTDSDADFAAMGTRTVTLFAGLFLENDALATVLAGKGTPRNGQFRRLSLKSVFGNRVSATTTGQVSVGKGIVGGEYSARGFLVGEYFAEAFEQDETSNAKLQGSWASDPDVTDDRFTLSIRRNSFTLRGTSADFGKFEYTGIWSALFNPDAGVKARRVKARGLPDFDTQIGLVPSKVRVPRGVQPFDAVNLPDSLFAFIDPKTGEMVIFLGIDAESGDAILTGLVQN